MHWRACIQCQSFSSKGAVGFCSNDLFIILLKPIFSSLSSSISLRFPLPRVQGEHSVLSSYRLCGLLEAWLKVLTFIPFWNVNLCYILTHANTCNQSSSGFNENPHFSRQLNRCNICECKEINSTPAPGITFKEAPGALQSFLVAWSGTPHVFVRKTRNKRGELFHLYRCNMVQV